MGVYEIRPRKDRRGYDLSGPSLPWTLWHQTLTSAISYAEYRVGTHEAELLIYDQRGEIVERKNLTPAPEPYDHQRQII